MCFLPLLQNLTLTMVSRVRTDSSVTDYRGTIGSSIIRFVSQSYDGGFISTPAALVLAVSGFRTITCSPKNIVGVLPIDKCVQAKGGGDGSLVSCPRLVFVRHVCVCVSLCAECLCVLLCVPGEMSVCVCVRMWAYFPPQRHLHPVLGPAGCLQRARLPRAFD